MGTKVRAGENNFFLGNIGVGVIPEERLAVAGNLSASGHLSGASFSGDWRGNVISGANISVEGINIKSTNINPFVQLGADFYLKASADGTATWDRIENNEIYFDNEAHAGNFDGDLTVKGDIIEYASDGVVYSKTSVFAKSLISGANTLNTFSKDQFKTAKYVISLVSGANITACEILVAHNGTTAEGTTYGIVDCQATSLLTDVSVSVGSNTIDLTITASSDCTATVNGVAHY